MLISKITTPDYSPAVWAVWVAVGVTRGYLSSRQAKSGRLTSAANLWAGLQSVIWPHVKRQIRAIQFAVSNLQ